MILYAEHRPRECSCIPPAATVRKASMTEKKARLAGLLMFMVAGGGIEPPTTRV